MFTVKAAGAAGPPPDAARPGDPGAAARRGARVAIYIEIDAWLRPTEPGAPGQIALSYCMFLSKSLIL